VVEKGSVAIDGVSLTVSALSGLAPPGEPSAADAAGWLEVSLIPETLERTTLGGKLPGEVVNLEVDMIGKYVERLLATGARA
jgi:riboflavin synthase